LWSAQGWLTTGWHNLISDFSPDHRMPRPYEILSLIERTDAWWAWRQGGIGSADAATILGIKPAKSAEQLLREKQNPPKVSGRNFVRAQGVALERAARALYVDAVGFPVEPTCVQNLARPWQRASLDGLSADGERAVEIKCGPANYQRASARQRPAGHHIAQLQHILCVTGLQVIDYWCYCPGRPPLRLVVRRDAAYIERLLAAEEVFWRRFASLTATALSACG
jgi:putative phage-type endonuclease